MYGIKSILITAAIAFTVLTPSTFAARDWSNGSQAESSRYSSSPYDSYSVNDSRYGGATDPDRRPFDQWTGNSLEQRVERERAEALSIMAKAMRTHSDRRFALVYQKLKTAKLRKGSKSYCSGGAQASINGQNVRLGVAAGYADPGAGTIYACNVLGAPQLIHEAIHLAGLFKKNGRYDECATEEFRKQIHQYSGAYYGGSPYYGMCHSEESQNYGGGRYN
jgi:hypothetical protein